MSWFSAATKNGLDPEERKEIEKHAQVGELCLDAIDQRLGNDGFLTLAREICAYHHEKWDGTGYPYGLRDEEIAISARRVSLADVYDALRSKRPYKDPMSHEAACRMIADGAGKHFDPAVVESFIEVHREFEAISKKYLNSRAENPLLTTQLPTIEPVALQLPSSRCI